MGLRPLIGNLYDRRAGINITAKENVCATRSYVDGPTNQSDGVATGQTARIQHYATVGCTNLRLLYGNWRWNGNEQLGTDTITVKASIDDGTNIYPVFFNGSRTVSILPGAEVLSDPVGVYFPAGTVLYTRTFVSVSLGAKWFKYFVYQVSGEGVADTDVTDSGSVTGGIGYCYVPSAIYGETIASSKQIAIIGDSLSGRQVSTGPDYGNPSVLQAFGPHFGSSYNVLHVGGDGESVVTFASTGGSIQRRRIIQGSTSALVIYAWTHYAQASLSAAQADIQALWAMLKSMGIQNIWQCTCPPYTNSTDGWITTQNQTPTTSPANEAIRVGLNNWFRTIPSPINGIFEIADVLESGRNSGVWKPNYTTDGLHWGGGATNAAAAEAGIIAAIDASKL